MGDVRARILNGHETLKQLIDHLPNGSDDEYSMENLRSKLTSQADELNQLRFYVKSIQYLDFQNHDDVYTFLCAVPRWCNGQSATFDTLENELVLDHSAIDPSG